MSENWEKAYPERINWVNRPATTTPINDVNLNKVDAALRTIDDRVISVGFKRTYDLTASKWSTGSDDSYYPYSYKIATADYEDDSTPDAVVYVNSSSETAEEHAAIESIGKIWCDHTGVTVYATSKPSMNLKLQLKGK